MSLDNDLESLAESVATDWPEIASSGRFVAAISEIYRSHRPFPQFWTQEERDEFVSDNADMDAAQLTTQLDDLIDIVIDRLAREHGFLPHHEDAAALIAAEHRAVVCELEDRIDALAQELAETAIHAPGPTVPSMTGCSQATRRHHAKTKRRSRDVGSQETETGNRQCGIEEGMKEVGSRRRNQPAPPSAVFDDLVDPHRQPARPWLQLRDDEVAPAVVDSDCPNYVVWSSLWSRHPDARLRFDLLAADGGTDLRWTLYVAEDALPDSTYLSRMQHRVNELINASLRYTYGQ